ncbi:unnamed protein product [Angiostrongylus costaricensis]|uniref:ZP domain-containing protein n=1 Tax=Angiostrongylus costaricensis TaxID=334426 RepID=A0A0R3PYU0_ANGCS|nr:unnamed protein product [Angiostrongylus costaricensis]
MVVTQKVFWECAETIFSVCDIASCGGREYREERRGTEDAEEIHAWNGTNACVAREVGITDDRDDGGYGPSVEQVHELEGGEDGRNERSPTGPTGTTSGSISFSLPLSLSLSFQTHLKRATACVARTVGIADGDDGGYGPSVEQVQGQERSIELTHCKLPGGTGGVGLPLIVPATMCCMRSIGDRAADEGRGANVVLKVHKLLR